MATGDQQDVVARIKAVLPVGWFADNTPVLNALLNGIAWSLALVYSLTSYARLQTRISTATDGFLDLISYDFFAISLPRHLRELDSAFRSRILALLFLERGTRKGIIRSLEILTGRTPTVFEPRRPADTGAYNNGALAYNTAGGYGCNLIPNWAFVKAYRPVGQGVPNIGGYGTSVGAYNTPSQAEYANPSLVLGAVTDADIYSAVDNAKAAATTMWVQIAS